MRISDWSSDVCSSDLPGLRAKDHGSRPDRGRGRRVRGAAAPEPAGAARRPGCRPQLLALQRPAQGEGRSEEHTSELQSLMRTSYAVFCLKKKTNRTKLTHLSKYKNKTKNITT